MTSVLAFICTIICLLTHTVQGYDTCTSRAQDFLGYTYKIDRNTSEKIWTHCDFPNPVYDPERCGRVASSSLTNYVCDPDYILDSASQGESVDLSLYNVQTNTSTVCTDQTGQGQSYIAAVLLINRIRMPDFQSPDLCANECGELHPELNTTARNATEAEENLLMEYFADKIRELWGLGACGNDVVVFYSQELNKVHISAGSRAKNYLSDSKIDSLSAELLAYINEGRLAAGLLYITEEIKDALQGVLTPAEILLITGMALSVFIALFLSFFLFAGERDMNVWGTKQPMKAFEWLIFVITGVWIVKATMTFSMYVTHKFPYVGAGVGILVAVTLFALYILNMLTEDANTTLTTTNPY